MLRSVTAAAFAVATAVASSQAIGSEPVPRPAQPMRVGQEVLAPYAFYDFCRRTPHECEAEATSAMVPALTDARWSELNEVNDIVNQTVKAKSDWDNYGVADYWTIANQYGDCEDYALTKQLYLRQRGWPISTLLMTVVRDENGEGHAVLTVRTGRGDLILDNRQPHIVAWTETPYTYMKRQSTLDPRLWLSLDGNPLARGSDAVAALPRHK